VGEMDRKNIIQSNLVVILTPYNDFDWNPKEEFQLRRKGLYNLTMATKTEPTSTIEKMRWTNRKDEATRILLDLISTNIWFHVSACKTPNKIWTTLEGLFGKQYEMRGHMLEVELNTLDPKSFDNIQDLFTKFKYLILSLGECGIDKSTQEKQLILTILAKLGPKYDVYVSNFHSSRCIFGTNWKMTTMDKFIESLTQEKKKLIQMGLMKAPKSHALTMHDGKGSSKQNRKEKQNEKEGYSKPYNDSSGSRDSSDSKKKKKGKQ
jgi:hypothetical protein